MIAVLLAAALAAPTLPVRSLSSLGDTPIELPPTEPTALIVTFARTHAEVSSAWQEGLGEQPWLQLAVVGDLGRTSRWIVTTAMKGAYDERGESRTALVLEEPEGWVTALELPDASEPVVLVAAGDRILGSWRGAPTEARLAEVRAALRP